MLQTRVHDGQFSADSSLQHSAALRNTTQFMSSKSVVILAFLIAVAGILWWASNRSNANRSLSIPATTQEASPNKLSTSEEQSQLSNDANAAETEKGNTNSVKVETTTNNGVTNTTLEVNGEQVPVKPNGTTQVTLPGGGQSVTNNVTTQTSGNGFNFSSNTSTSSSSSFTSSSTNVVGGPK
jgi:cytoskeletal protein RodZ